MTPKTTLARMMSATAAAGLCCLLLSVGCEPNTIQTYNPSPAQMEEAASGRSPTVGKVAPDFSLQDHGRGGAVFTIVF